MKNAGNTAHVAAVRAEEKTGITSLVLFVDTVLLL